MQSAMPDLARLADAREHLKFWRSAPDLDEFAEVHSATFWDCPPDIFCPSRAQIRRDIKKALEPHGWATHLLFFCAVPMFLTFLVVHLGLPAFCGDFRLFHDAETVRMWRDALKAAIAGPFWWRLEVGKNGVIHAHVLTDAGSYSGPGVRRVVYNLAGLLRYLKKPLAPWTAENLAVYLKGRRAADGGRVPRHSGPVGIGNSRTWAARA